MSRTNALASAIAAAQRQRDLARRTLARQQQVLHTAQAQMEQLHSYTREMQQRWGARPGQRASAALLHHYQQFMACMAHASAVQTGVLQERQNQIQKARHHLSSRELRLDSLRQLAVQRQRAQQRQERQREEQQANERSTLHFLRQRSAAQHPDNATRKDFR